MIDYKELSEKFSNKLKEFNKEKLLKWLDFDQNREVVGKLLCGENVAFKYETSTPYKLKDNRENIDSYIDNNSYAMAA